MRLDVETVWIHKGNKPFGGGNNNLLIHTGQAADYISAGILEETLVHEAAHTSLDGQHATSHGWLNAQTADNQFVSQYAQDNPTREDIAETFLVYLAARHRNDRIEEEMRQTILESVAHRVAYFEQQGFNLFPLAN